MLLHSLQLPCFHCLHWGLLLAWARHTSHVSWNELSPAILSAIFPASWWAESRSVGMNQTDMTLDWFIGFDPFHRGWKQNKTWIQKEKSFAVIHSVSTQLWQQLWNIFIKECWSFPVWALVFGERQELTSGRCFTHPCSTSGYGSEQKPLLLHYLKVLAVLKASELPHSSALASTGRWPLLHLLPTTHAHALSRVVFLGFDSQWVTAPGSFCFVAKPQKL